jgi:NADPH:quinone reductase
VSRVLVKAARSLAVPETFSANQALRSHALTVQYLVAEYRGVRPGDRVLVHSATGAGVDLAFDAPRRSSRR